jgi:hypothetical protein
MSLTQVCSRISEYQFLSIS